MQIKYFSTSCVICPSMRRDPRMPPPWCSAFSRTWFRDQKSIILLRQMTHYGNPYLFCTTMKTRHFGDCRIWSDNKCLVLFLHGKQNFCSFFCNPCIINSCWKTPSINVIYNTLLDSNDGNILQTIYYQKMRIVNQDRNPSDKIRRHHFLN